jgi:hypothetical protein
MHPDGNKALVVMQQAADDVDQAKRSSTPGLISSNAGASSILAGIQLRESVRKWLSPPDPSTNHNIACGAHLKGTATWFLEGSTYQNWKSSSSLLGIYGKRMFFNCYQCHTPDGSSSPSWLREECTLVCRFLTICPRLLM